MGAELAGNDRRTLASMLRCRCAGARRGRRRGIAGVTPGRTKGNPSMATETKQPYQAPEITRHGDIREITRSGLTGGADSGPGTHSRGGTLS